MDRRSTVCWVLCGLLAACAPSENDASGAGMEVSDSAGVRIVLNTHNELPLSATEVHRIGVVDGDPNYQFAGIRSLAVDSAGGIWVVDTDPTVRHYGPSGAYEGAVGGAGAGPGESLRGYAEVWLSGGEIAAYAGPAGVQRFDPNGTLLGSGRSGLGSVYLTPLSRNGHVWNLMSRVTEPDSLAGLRNHWIVGRGPIGGESQPAFDTLVVLEGERRVGEPGHSATGSFFDGAPSVAGGPDGRIVYAHGSDYRIEIYDGQGRLAEVIARDIEPVPYPTEIEGQLENAVRESLIEIYEGRPDWSPREDEVRRIAAAATPVTTPDRIPALEGIMVASDGHIWAIRADQHPSPAHRAVAHAFGYIRTAWLDVWLAPTVLDQFAPSGEYRGTVRLPTRFIPMAVTRDRVYGVATDELDVQYIVTYEARR